MEKLRDPLRLPAFVVVGNLIDWKLYTRCENCGLKEILVAVAKDLGLSTGSSELLGLMEMLFGKEPVHEWGQLETGLSLSDIVIHGKTKPEKSALKESGRKS